MTADRAAIRARWEAASDTPWHAFYSLQGDPFVVPADSPLRSRQIAMVSVAPADYGKANCEAIAHAPTDIAALLADLDAAEAEVSRLIEINNGAEQYNRGIEAERDAVRAELAADQRRTQAVLDVAQAERDALRATHDALRKYGNDGVSGYVGDAERTAAVLALEDENATLRARREAAETLLDEWAGASLKATDVIAASSERLKGRADAHDGLLRCRKTTRAFLATDTESPKP